MIAARPKIGKHVFVHPSAVILGKVTLKDHSSIWPGAVLRADLNRIVIGKYSNIQDLSVVHLESNLGTFVGDYCVIGHQVILHGCTISDGVLVGMGTVILSGAKIGNGSIIGAGSLVTENAVIKPGSLYFGRPAKYIRKCSRKEIQETIQWAKKYARLAGAHVKGTYTQL